MSTDDVVEEILSTFDTITVVGASANSAKPANEVPAYMQAFGWRIVPVNPTAQTIVGEKVYPTIADVAEQVGFIDVFRPAADAPEIARQAVAAGASALWLQLGIVSPQARQIAQDAGLLYVEDRCLKIEQRRTGITPTRS
ncbi:MAG: CoA-binding protein [Gordonia sp. (in: high G+C Gram-positive bacteria)]